MQFPRLRRGVGAQFLAQPGAERRVGEQRLAGSPARAAADMDKRQAASSSGSSIMAASA